MAGAEGVRGARMHVTTPSLRLNSRFAGNILRA